MIDTPDTLAQSTDIWKILEAVTRQLVVDDSALAPLMLHVTTRVQQLELRSLTSPTDTDFLASAREAQTLLKSMEVQLGTYIQVEGAHRAETRKLQRRIVGLQTTSSEMEMSTRALASELELERGSLTSYKNRVKELEEERSIAFPEQLRKLNCSVTTLSAELAESRSEARAWKQRASTFKGKEIKVREGAKKTWDIMAEAIRKLQTKVNELEANGNEGTLESDSQALAKLRNGFEAQLATLSEELQASKESVSTWKERAEVAKTSYMRLKDSAANIAPHSENTPEISTSPEVKQLQTNTEALTSMVNRIQGAK